MSKMFPFITKTWNPLAGECTTNCSYCWAKKLIKKYGMKKYTGEPRLIPSELKKRFTDKDFVFAQDMSDLFNQNVPTEMIQQVLDTIKLSPATYLLLTKNPRRYLEFNIPDNCVCGVTIETDLIEHNNRFVSMRQLKHKRKFISIEPILFFSPNFIHDIRSVHPEFVAVGYDNYNNGLKEPSLEITEILIEGIEASGIKVYRKTIREKQ